LFCDESRLGHEDRKVRAADEASMLNSVVRQVMRVLMWQSAWLVLITGAAALLWGAQAAWSMLAGSAIGLAATAYLATVLVKRSLQIGKRPSVLGLFGNWLVKSALTVGLLMMAFRSKKMLPLLVLAAWFGSLATYWLCVVLVRANGARGKYQNGDDGK
jgi:hypothetical protein